MATLGASPETGTALKSKSTENCNIVIRSNQNGAEKKEAKVVGLNINSEEGLNGSRSDNTEGEGWAPKRIAMAITVSQEDQASRYLAR